MQSQERKRPGLSRHDDPLSRYCIRLMLVVHSFSSGFEEEKYIRSKSTPFSSAILRIWMTNDAKDP